MDCTALLQEMIRIPSFTREEQQISAFLVERLRPFCDQAWVDDLNNVLAVLEGKPGGPLVMLNGHIDHAFIGDMEEPFGGTLTDGSRWGSDGPAVYGRGACDNKGAVAAMVSALAELSARRDFKGAVILAAVALEETGDGTGIKKVLADLRQKPDIVLLGEATNLDICLGHRGKLEFELETIGATAHSSNPGNGVNAILLVQRFLNAWKDFPLPKHAILGQCTSAVTNIHCAPGKPFIIPDHCWLNFDRRYLPEERPADVEGAVREFLADLANESRDFNWRLKLIQHMPPFLTPAENPFVRPLQETVKRHAREPRLRGWLFGTDGTYIVRDYGIPVIGFGPGDERFAHTSSDHVTTRDLEVSVRVYRDFVVHAGELRK